MANINPEKYPHEDLRLLSYYKSTIEEILNELNDIKQLYPSLYNKAWHLHKNIEWHIQNIENNGQPKAPRLPTDF
ncbi:MAG: hypothetical protein RM347_003750 [Nostoc sp. ChiQUE02]|uniref:hypothetical protein n=1 Tax=Nostoc sp. ChiQUE02 TaxID=3075377 RepID=UPI002AD48DD2|nr:hypothetical protein [Nostoc sp. ChiQUE02]MDZ8232073.1 hypothetical protein [Nostoc sp. ChiQUE02]